MGPAFDQTNLSLMRSSCVLIAFTCFSWLSLWTAATRCQIWFLAGLTVCLTNRRKAREGGGAAAAEEWRDLAALVGGRAQRVLRRASR